MEQRRSVPAWIAPIALALVLVVLGYLEMRDARRREAACASMGGILYCPRHHCFCVTDDGVLP